MKAIWKVLGITSLAAAAAALVPYKVKKDEETGETKAKALLWEGSHTPGTEDHEREIVVNVKPDLTPLKQKVDEIKEKVVSESEPVDIDVDLEIPVIDPASEAPETPEVPLW